MITYNKTYLKNKQIQDEAAAALKKHLITPEEYSNILSRYPSRFYTPNIFIRVGLFILSSVILSFSFGLFGLLFMNSFENTWKGLLLFFSLLTYGALEVSIQSGNHYKSGVDDALTWHFSAMFLLSICEFVNAGPLTIAILTFIVSLYCTLRFADRVMGVIVFVSVLAILFFTFTDHINISKAFIPFVLMIASALTFGFLSHLKKNKRWSDYQGCILWSSIASLLFLYASANYFIVREANNLMFHLSNDGSLPFGWLFWLFTITIPITYLALGIVRKSTVFIRVGLLLIAATVFTIRYYYSAIPYEMAMTIAGVLLLGISYLLIRYLKEPKYGFTYEATDSDSGKLQIEALIISETAGLQSKPDNTTKFGGGSFGGGGTGADF